jgi:hypothetical protein
MKRVALAIVLVACDRRTPIDSCRDDLEGIWVDEASRQWMVLDFGATLEGYPLFDDVGARTQIGIAREARGGVNGPALPDQRGRESPLSIESAPRKLELGRTGERVHGVVRRRYMLAGDSCNAEAELTVSACGGDTLELRFADPSPPTRYGPCAWGANPPARTVRWTRVPVIGSAKLRPE